MAISLKGFIQSIEKVRKDLNAVSGAQLQSQTKRDSIRSLVELYFKEVRPSLVSDKEQSLTIKQVDDDLQTLLSMCHKKGTVKGYRNLLMSVKKNLITLDAQVILSKAVGVQTQQIDSTDEQIVITLQRLVPSAALSYQQAVVDLQTDIRFSWRGPATDLRESLRETLDCLAPDSDVKAMAGYKQSADTHGPTMKQKVQFILKNRGIAKTISAPAEAAVEGVEEAIGTFVRSVYSRSSISTHTPTDKAEVLRVRDFVRVALCELLEIHAS
jgi:hypothetical protein